MWPKNLENLENNFGRNTSKIFDIVLKPSCGGFGINVSISRYLGKAFNTKIMIQISNQSHKTHISKTV